jgi:ABC-type multidrug transport system fused ATPase/permease subunit
MKAVMANKSKKTNDSAQFNQWPFGKKNYILFAVALVVIIVGFIALGKGSITLAPILLVFGYCVMIPWAILSKGKKESEEISEGSNLE